MLQRLLLLLALCHLAQSQQDAMIQPFMALLRPESMSRMVEIASELSSLAATNVANNERSVAAQAQANETPLSTDAKPSQMLGQAFSNIASRSRNSFLGALAPFEKKDESVTKASDPIGEGPLNALGIRPVIPPRPTQTGEGIVIKQLENSDPVAPVELASVSPEIRLAPPQAAGAKTFALTPPVEPPVFQPIVKPTIQLPAETAPGIDFKQQVPAAQFAENPFMKLANTFLRGASGQSQRTAAQGVPTSNAGREVPMLGIKDFVPGADNNFGIPKGDGCLPFLSEFLQVAYGNCQQVADEKAFDAWGNELKNAILTGQIDLLKASQETCRRGAERQQCASLRQALATCDILQSLQIGGQLQRAMKRCEEVSGLVDQNPMVILGQINNLIGGEFAQGFFNNFLGGGQKGR